MNNIVEFLDNFNYYSKVIKEETLWQQIYSER